MDVPDKMSTKVRKIGKKVNPINGSIKKKTKRGENPGGDVTSLENALFENSETDSSDGESSESAVFEGAPKTQLSGSPLLPSSQGKFNVKLSLLPNG